MPRGDFELGSLESTGASRSPAILAEFHGSYPDVRMELTTGTNDWLLGELARRRLDIAEPPSDGAFEHMRAFSERLTLISNESHPPIKRARDIGARSLIAFPEGCSYRRAPQFGADSLVTFRVLDLSSYHAIVAGVAAGTGIALESVLAAMLHAKLRKHPIPKAQASVTTSLVWRRGEICVSVLALRTRLASQKKENRA
jgi:DNA-binding transcriptional LysR family regulator